MIYRLGNTGAIAWAGLMALNFSAGTTEIRSRRPARKLSLPSSSRPKIGIIKPPMISPMPLMVSDTATAFRPVLVGAAARVQAAQDR